MTAGITAPLRLSVFAVEDTAAQVCWAALPSGGVSLAAGDVRVTVGGGGRNGDDGPGAVVLDGLEPDTAYELRMVPSEAATAGGARGAERVVAHFKTLAPPPGRLLARFATISDLHIGERGFGVLPRFREELGVPVDAAYPARCAKAAIIASAAWGAERIVVKGDLTWSGRPLQWQVAADLLAASPVPLHVTLGNHDVVPRAIDERSRLAERGIVVTPGSEHVDIAGVRIVVVDSTVDGQSRGSVDEATREVVTALVADAPGPAFVALHHYVNRLPVPTRYPRGIPRDEGNRLLAALAAANRATFVTFGHTHRHRHMRRFGLPLVEVGSTKDYPGVWAGYAVHEGGIRQVVRRISEPSCLAWTEQTRLVLGGAWGRWSPGRRAWRCFSHRWPDR